MECWKLKKLLIGCLALNFLIVSGCQSEKNYKQISVVEAKPEINVYDVSYRLDAYSEGRKVKVTVTIEINKDQPILLLTKNGHLFSIELKKKDGTLIERKIIDQKDRRQILKKEMVTWDIEFEGNMDEELIVKSDLLLKSKKYHHYNIENDVQTKTVTVSTPKLETNQISFTPNPNKEVIYVYETNDNKKIKEEFRFFNGNKVQSFSKENGVQIYSQEPDGIYYFWSPDPIGDIDGTEFIEKKNMGLLIPFPIEEGKTWSVGDKQYKLSDQSVKVKTPLGLFNGCVEVTEKSKGTIKYYYYHKDIGLLKVKRKRKGLPSLTELQLIKIEEPNQQKNKEKE